MTEAAPEIPPQRRELYLRIWDNYPKFHLITWRLHFIDGHFPPDKIDRALKWLIANRHTGAAFVRWFSIECKNSDLEMHRKLLEVVNNQGLERVIAGKNFKA